MYDDLVEFLQESVTPFHAAATAESWLRAAGFTRLEEADYWNLEPGKGYYTTRNGSSVVAWRVPQHAIGGWRIVASHVHLAGPPADRRRARPRQDRGRHREPPCVP